MIKIFKKVPDYNFIGVRKYAFLFSGILLLITAGSVIYHKGFNTSIEFKGGTSVQLRFEKPVEKDLGKIRAIASVLDFGQPEVKTIGATNNNEIQIIVKKQAEGTFVGDQIKDAIKEKYPENPFVVRFEEKVGPKIGAEMIRKSTLAIFFSLIAIIVYVWIRFNLPYGLGGVVALFHDVFIVLGFFSLTNREISLSIIAALLTIVGFSINDTIVIFDRVRENLGGKLFSSGTSLEDTINRSINQTLSRTIITSSTVLFVLIAFSFFGGEVIRDFALAMLVGSISGVYSTIYIASPVVIWWYRKWPKK
jgi:preprotein translocase SecF subunit